MATHDQPKVLVVLPIYLRGAPQEEEWLLQSLSSVEAQSYGNWHIALVDDGSPTDIPETVLARCEHLGKSCTLIRRRCSGGAADARMEAIAHSQADIVTFIDQDDIWIPTKLSFQVNYFLANPDMDAVHGNVVFIDKDGTVLADRANRENEARLRHGFEALDCSQLSASLFTRNTIRIISSAVRDPAFRASGGFDRQLRGGEDWEFWVRFSSKFRIGYLHETLIKRRVHSHNTSSVNRLERLEGQLDALQKMGRDLAGLESLIPIKRAQILSKVVEAAYTQKAWWRFLKYRSRQIMQGQRRK